MAWTYESSPRRIADAVSIWELSEAEEMQLRRWLDSNGVLVGNDLDSAPLTWMKLGVNRVLARREQRHG